MVPTSKQEYYSYTIHILNKRYLATTTCVVFLFLPLFFSFERKKKETKHTNPLNEKKNIFQKTLNSFFWISLFLEKEAPYIRHTNPFYTPLSLHSHQSLARVYNTNTSKEGGGVVVHQIRKKKGSGFSKCTTSTTTPIFVCLGRRRKKKRAERV